MSSAVVGSSRRTWRAEVDEAALGALAGALARRAPGEFVMYLSGELGAGKTTFARAFIRALVPGVRVKSPSFALIEPYQVGARELYHVDLYRIADPHEIEALALRELAKPDSGLLIEWPERGVGLLPAADLELALEHAGATRKLSLLARTERGDRWMDSAG